ncbi:MAG: GIY-YIG nuclease family protein [Actinobacteria bacterium]|nr:GIY-YIG nuclease family protein [Actinomycetota bacterium]
MAEEKKISISIASGATRRKMMGVTVGSTVEPGDNETVVPGEGEIGYIYFLRTREFRLLGRPLYKVGRTTQVPDTKIRRLQQYTKGSEVICLERCDATAVKIVEREIMRRLRAIFPPGPDGSEDFYLPNAEDVFRVREFIHEVVMEAEKGGSAVWSGW